MMGIRQAAKISFTDRRVRPSRPSPERRFAPSSWSFESKTAPMVGLAPRSTRAFYSKNPLAEITQGESLRKPRVLNHEAQKLSRLDGRSRTTSGGALLL